MCTSKERDSLSHTQPQLTYIVDLVGCVRLQTLFVDVGRHSKERLSREGLKSDLEKKGDKLEKVVWRMF